MAGHICTCKYASVNIAINTFANINNINNDQQKYKNEPQRRDDNESDVYLISTNVNRTILLILNTYERKSPTSLLNVKPPAVPHATTNTPNIVNKNVNVYLLLNI